MKIRKALKFNLNPTSERRQKMIQTAGSGRLDFNTALVAFKEVLGNKGVYQGYGSLAGGLKA